MANINMRLIREMTRRPPNGLIMARLNEDATFNFLHRIQRRLLKDYPILCINEDTMHVFIDIRQAILDENLHDFKNSFGFGGDGFPRTRTRIFRGYKKQLDIIIANILETDDKKGVFSRLRKEEKQAYLASFCASVRLENGDTYLWLNTNIDVNYMSTSRDSVIYERMTDHLPAGTLNAGIPYRSEVLYPFGYISATLDFPESDPPVIRFISPITHPNIFPDGMVDPRIYDENWTEEQSVKNMLDSILRILKEPDRRYRANEEAARRLWEQEQQE